MADSEVLINGVNGDSVEFVDPEHPPKKTTDDARVVDQLNRKIEALEQEKSNLERENDESLGTIGVLKDQVVDLRREKEAETERAGSERRAAEAIAKRAAELEGEVVRLQHDLITAMNEGEEANREVQELRAKIGELEEKARRGEEEMCELRREKKVVEDSVAQLQALLEESKEKVRLMEDKMEEMAKTSEESKKLVDGLMEKVTERDAIPEGIVDEQSSIHGFKRLKTQLPLVGAFSAGAVVAAMAVCYIRHSRN